MSYSSSLFPSLAFPHHLYFCSCSPSPSSWSCPLSLSFPMFLFILSVPPSFHYGPQSLSILLAFLSSSVSLLLPSFYYSSSFHSYISGLVLHVLLPSLTYPARLSYSIPPFIPCCFHVASYSLACPHSFTSCSTYPSLPSLSVHPFLPPSFSPFSCFVSSSPSSIIFFLLFPFYSIPHLFQLSLIIFLAFPCFILSFSFAMGVISLITLWKLVQHDIFNCIDMWQFRFGCLGCKNKKKCTAIISMQAITCIAISLDTNQKERE